MEEGEASFIALMYMQAQGDCSLFSGGKEAKGRTALKPAWRLKLIKYQNDTSDMNSGIFPVDAV